MSMRKSLESLTLELSEINEKQAHIINKLTELLLRYMSQDDIDRLLTRDKQRDNGRGSKCYTDTANYSCA